MFNAKLLNASKFKDTDGATRLQGNIYNDQKGRFKDGEFIYTSPIQYTIGRVYQTKNTAYYVEFAHESIKK